MGTYLTTSLLRKFSIGKSSLDLIDGNIEEKYEIILSEFLQTDIGVFNVSESESTIIFEVKKEILKEELIPFLKIFFYDFDKANEEYKLIIKTLEQKNDVEKWLELADNSEYQNFQTDNYSSEIIYYKGNRIRIGYTSIILAMEGKIIMESYGKHFSFLENLIKKTYSTYKVSNLILINISG